MDKSRQQFEAWLYEHRVRGVSFNIDKFEIDGEIYYVSPEIQGQWRAWEASRAAIEIELPLPSYSRMDLQAATMHRVSLCKNVLRAIGLKIKGE